MFRDVIDTRFAGHRKIEDSSMDLQRKRGPGVYTHPMERAGHGEPLRRGQYGRCASEDCQGSNDCPRLLLEPLFVLVVQMRGQLVINLPVIIVEPLTLKIGEHFGNNGTAVDRHIAKRFKAHELPVFSFFVFHNEQCVLRADSVTAFLIDARFDGDGHALFQPNIVLRLGKALGLFMDVGKITDAVAGPALVVKAGFP